MIDRRIHIWVTAALLALAALLAPAAAAANPIAPSCHADSDRGSGPYAALPHADGWNCSPNDFNSSKDVTWLLFTRGDLSRAKDATHFVTRISRFDSLSLLVQRADGSLDRTTYRMSDVERFVNGPRFAVPLPDIDGAQSLIVAIERPWNAAIASEAGLQDARATSLGWSAGVMLLIAIFLGLLASPLLYNFAFYRVLREKFVLWHTLIVVGMMSYVLISSGMIHQIVDLDIQTLAVINPVSFLLPCVAAAGFCVTYLEPTALSPAMRKTVMRVAVGTMLVAGVMCFPIAAIRRFSNDLYYLAYLPLVVVYAAALVQAVRNNSRAVWFQIAAWLPVIVSGLERIVRGIGLYAAPPWVDQIIYLAIALEVLVTAMGVVDRFDVLRRDRDRVNARLDMLSSLVDRDALTGIYNRRALEERFADLRDDGFTAIAVIDLDHFKRVNDRFGHQMGDRVLKEVASVLTSDDDGLAFRMGGEEFLIMLRGQNVEQRAEKLRRAITIRIANEIDGMEGPVTASMGLVESPPGAAMTLRRLYAHADRLLYEAKNSGRNRMISERIQLFEAASDERRLDEDRRIGERRDDPPSVDPAEKEPRVAGIGA